MWKNGRKSIITEPSGMRPVPADLLHVARDVVVAEHDALGRAGGPGRSRGGRPGRSSGRWSPGRGRRRRAAARSQTSAVWWKRPSSPHTAAGGVVGDVGDEDGLGLGVAELVGDLPLLVERVQRGDRGAGQQGTVEGDDPLRRVGGDDADAVARARSPRPAGQRATPARGLPDPGEGVLGVGDPVDQGDALRPGLRRVLQQLADRRAPGTARATGGVTPGSWPGS